MSKQTGSYEAVDSDPVASNRRGRPGQQLFLLRDPVRWYIIGVTIYALASIGILGWSLTCPADGKSYRVLRTGDLKVDQFYSGLFLSVLLAPVGIMVRRIANDLALLHPFAVASEQPVKLAHLDMMTDPGLLATITLGRYSLANAFIQTILIATGALIVPIGTLLVTTGDYTGITAGSGVVGLPAGYNLHLDMEIFCADPKLDCLLGPTSFLFGDTDKFILSADTLLRGTLISQSGVLYDAPQYFGPVPNSNITFQEGVTYHDVITYHWTSGCEYSTEITYQPRLNENMVDISLPNGTNTSWSFLYLEEPLFAVAGIADNWLNNHAIPLGGSIYLAVGYITSATVNVSRDSPGLDFFDIPGSTLDASGPDTFWISRVKCTPSLEWKTNDCVWHNKTWTDCVDSPKPKLPKLDLLGLFALPYYFTALPFYTFNESPKTGAGRGNTYNGVYGIPTVMTALTFAPATGDKYQVRAPLLKDYDNMYGLFAQVLTTLTLSGYYGTATVETTGSPPYPVYLIRMYILYAIMVLLLAIPIISVSSLVARIQKGIPLRRATLLTIANAVRGPWWDETLWGGCAMSPEELRTTQKKSVIYGVDASNPRHIGLAPQVETIMLEGTYWGVRKRENMEEKGHRCSFANASTYGGKQSGKTGGAED